MGGMLNDLQIGMIKSHGNGNIVSPIPLRTFSSHFNISYHSHPRRPSKRLKNQDYGVAGSGIQVMDSDPRPKMRREDFHHVRVLFSHLFSLPSIHALGRWIYVGRVGTHSFCSVQFKTSVSSPIQPSSFCSLFTPPSSPSSSFIHSAWWSGW